MIEKLIIKLTIFLLKKDLSEASRNKLITCILDKLYVLPLKEIIVRDEQGTFLVSGKPLELEKLMILRESARSALQSVALKLINEQVLFNAVTIGVHRVEKPEQLMFSRAAIWWGQQQDSLLKLLANEDGTAPNADL